jgi:hypothetical protein
MTWARRGAPPTFQVVRPPPTSEQSWQYPEYLPPFLYDAVWFSPDGVLWVRRTTAPKAPPTFDNIDDTGRLVERIALPPRTKLVGFGAGTVYVVRIDDNDLQYLQRFASPLRRQP